MICPMLSDVSKELVRYKNNLKSQLSPSTELLLDLLLDFDDCVQICKEEKGDETSFLVHPEFVTVLGSTFISDDSIEEHIISLWQKDEPIFVLLQKD